MNYEMFQEGLVAEVKRLTDSGTQISIQHMQKNNCVILDALCICRKNDEMAPLIYLDGFYRRHRQGVPISHLAKLLLSQYHDIPKIPPEAMDSFRDFSKAQNHIYCRIVNYDLNARQLDPIPHKRFLDLAITCYFQVDNETLRDATITITENHCSLWGISPNRLHQIAWNNTINQLPSQLQNMEETLGEILSEEESLILEDVSTASFSPVPMYILTNSRRCLGAICMMYPGILAKAAESFQSNLYILPSSIHECILIPESKAFPKEELEDMVEHINTTQLEPQELLSNHVYFYDWKEDSIHL